MLATQKAACFVEVGLEIKLAARAPRTNLVKRVLGEKTFTKETGKRCIHKNLGYDFSVLNQFTIMSKITAVVLLYLLNTFQNDNWLWMNAKFVYETNLFFYLGRFCLDFAGSRIKTNKNTPIEPPRGRAAGKDDQRDRGLQALQYAKLKLGLYDAGRVRERLLRLLFRVGHL